MEITNNWILPALILVPFIAGFICWLVDKLDDKLPRYIALIGMLITLGLTVALWQTGTFNYELGAKVPSWSAEFMLPWIQTLGINIHLAVDGLSLLMVGLTALLGVLAVGCSWGEIQKNVGFFHLNLLWSLGGVIGVFLAIDMFLFFFFWEMMLVPIYFLIALWGHKGAEGKSRVYAATKFFIYTQVAGLIMLIVFLAVPALQRNSRNTQRTNDASRISSAVTECLNNKNGKVASCDGFTGGEIDSYITLADNQQLTTPGTAGVNSFALAFSTKCNDTGETAAPGGGTRAFTITYRIETTGSGTGNRCIGS